MVSALELAIEEFKKIDLKNIYERSGAVFNRQNIEIDYLNQKYSIKFPGGEFISSGKEDIPLKRKVIILHYLNRGRGAPLSGRQVDFRETPGGNIYYSVFKERIHRSLLKTFGGKPPLLLDAALLLNGQKTGFGDMSVKLPVFPKVPMEFVIHKGDEEFPPDCKVLFDSSISDYLSTEDIVIACEDTVKELRLRLK